MSITGGIPKQVVESVRRELGNAPNLSDRSVNRLAHQLEQLNANMRRLIELEEKRQARRESENEQESNSD